MIVIATNNGKRFIENLLSDLDKFSIKLPISLIDTQSTDLDSIDYINKAKDLFPNLNLNTYTTPGKNFDTGAYMYAINNLMADRYYFLHDSLRIKTPVFFEEIDKKLIPGTVVALTIFPGNCYDGDDQRSLCQENWNTTEFVSGIFGPMFSILRSDVEKHWNELPKRLPSNKSEQMGMERGWAVFCNKCGIHIEDLEKVHTFNQIYTDGYVHFTKLFPNRNR